MSNLSILIAGAGIFGATAALELKRRGHNVTVVDPGPIPHPLAASTDISKVVRMEYGADEDYMALMEQVREGWLAWNDGWTGAGGDPLYHETGVVMICREPMAPGGFEYESWQLLCKRGHAPERLDSGAVRRRFPAWRAEHYVDGFFHAKGGYAESGRVVEAILRQARLEGATLIEGEKVTALSESGGVVRGATTNRGRAIVADVTVLATGAWTDHLAFNLKQSIRATGHPVFHLRPDDPSLFAPASFPAFTADVSTTGYYGFPVNRDGVVKIANHGLGVHIDADDERVVTTEDEARLRRFLTDTFPTLEGADIVYTRLCLYADTQDEHFWIARDPDREGLVVASGGSGHGFKFAPVLGGLTADCVDDTPNPWLARFGWRPDLRMESGQEAARCHREDDSRA